VEKAIEQYEQALAIAREIGDRQGEGSVLGALGNAYSDLGQVEKANEQYEQALAIARELGHRQNEGIHAWNLGLLYEKDDPEKAVALMAICVEYEEAIGHPDAQADAQQVADIAARINK
jgi:tetratricopeptide (TPR) repeat protein